MAVTLWVISKGDHLQQGYLKIVTKYSQDDDDRNHYVDVLLIRMMAMTILVVMMKLTMLAITTLVLNYFNWNYLWKSTGSTWSSSFLKSKNTFKNLISAINFFLTEWTTCVPTGNFIAWPTFLVDDRIYKPDTVWSPSWPSSLCHKQVCVCLSGTKCWCGEYHDPRSLPDPPVSTAWSRVQQSRNHFRFPHSQVTKY